jgi:gamma-glutamyltranspeptidase/glutathione hydrolase
MRRSLLSKLAVAASLVLLAVPAAEARTRAHSRPAPAAAQRTVFDRGMVVAANPLAVEAGLKVLGKGGSAVDAAVAIQAVLGLVEPQSSGLGGGAFLLYLDGKTHQLTAYDGREAAPAAATPSFFLNADGSPMQLFDAILSGKSTGPPGAIAMLGLAHDQHGRLPWKDLFGEGERLAADGFPVSARLAMESSFPLPQTSAPDIAAYFTKADGTHIQAGDVLKNPAYARTLQAIAAQGPRALLEGPLATDIAARVGQDPGAVMTAQDLKAYHPLAEPALCRPYRIYVVCVPPSPSGGPALLLMLGILARTDIDKRGPNDPEAWFQMAQAQRLAYVDRERYLGDPRFVHEPIEGLLSPAYLDQRAKLIGQTAGPAPAPGIPPGAVAEGKDATQEAGGTSHFTVVDRQGDVVAMTTSVESIFGSGRMVDGFVLNNQLTDFSFVPVDRAGRPAANRVEAGKRPRSAMTPVIVLKNGRW